MEERTIRVTRTTRSQSKKEMALALAITIKPEPDSDGADSDEERSEHHDDPGVHKRALDSLVNFLNEEIKARGRGGKRKRKPKFPLDAIRVLDVHAESFGFTNSELETIWKVASSEKSDINCTQRRKLIFTMIPKGRVGGNVIRSIVWWLWSAAKNGFKTSVLMAAYQLLNYYVDYGLTEYNAISNAHTLTRLLQTPTENTVIPWKMSLFRKMVSPTVLEKIHIYHLNELLKSKNAKKTQLEDIKSCLSMCNHLRPDFFEGSGTRITSLGKLRFLQYPRGTQDRFYNCKQRLMNQPETSIHDMSDQIFRVLLPTSGTPGGTQLDTMFQLLKTMEGTIELALRPPLLRVFCDWFQLVFYHKFRLFFEISGQIDENQYKFILERCCLITEVRQEGIEVISKWVMKILVLWDFESHKTFVYKLLRFVNPCDVLPTKDLVGLVLFQRFTYSPWTRLDIWECLRFMRDAWISKFISDDASLTPQDKNDLTEGIIWVLHVMEGLVSAHISEPVTEMAKRISFIYEACASYNDLMKEFDKIPSDRVKSKILSIPPALVPSVVLSEHVECVEKLCEMFTRLDAIKMGNQNESIETGQVLWKAYRNGAIVPYLEKNSAKFPPLLTHAVIASFRQFQAAAGTEHAMVGQENRGLLAIKYENIKNEIE